MLGGATPGINGVVPSDVVFRRNHVTRPVSWRTASWAVKNLFELKNARRVLVEGNLFEAHWPDAQAGYAIVFTPRGEGGAAPWAVVEDVTFRYNVVRNVAAVFDFLARDNNGASGPLRRVRIVDNLFYGVDRSVWGGNGVFLQIGEGPAEISVEHNTIVQTGNIITAYGGTRAAPSAAPQFVFKDNITLHNANGVIGTGSRSATTRCRSTSPARRSIATSSRALSPHAIRPTTRFRRWSGSGNNSRMLAITTIACVPAARCANPEATARRGCELSDADRGARCGRGGVAGPAGDCRGSRRTALGIEPRAVRLPTSGQDRADSNDAGSMRG